MSGTQVALLYVPGIKVSFAKRATGRYKVSADDTPGILALLLAGNVKNIKC